MAAPRGEKLCIINAAIKGHLMDQENRHSSTPVGVMKGEIIIGHSLEGLCQSSLFHILGTFHGVRIFAISTGEPCGAFEGAWTAGGGVDIPSKYIIVGKLSYIKEIRLLIKQASAKFRD